MASRESRQILKTLRGKRKPVAKPPATNDELADTLIKQAQDVVVHERFGSSRDERIFIRGYLISAMYRAKDKGDFDIAAAAFKKEFRVSDEEIAMFYVGG